MADFLTPAERSERMSRIRGRGNETTELALARLFRAHGFTGWRRHRPVFGKPDFVFAAARVAVFVDGCFWHACAAHLRMPRTNRRFWKKKLDANQARDRRVNRTLKARGWRVVRVWQHELKRRNEARLVARLRRRLGTV